MQLNRDKLHLFNVVYFILVYILEQLIESQMPFFVPFVLALFGAIMHSACVWVVSFG